VHPFRVAKHVQVVLGAHRHGRWTRSDRTDTALLQLQLPVHPSSFRITPMQVTSGLKKRSPFAFASDEDNLVEDTGFLDDQGESLSARASHGV
jgi:hypothetical protein